jgi:PAS domain S-box-containing protein
MTGSDKPFDKKTLGGRLDVHFALQAAGLGVWEVDPQTNHVQWDDRCRELFGLAKDHIVTYQQAVQHIHPEDIDQVNKAVNWAMNPESDGFYDQTFRTLGVDDGHLRWVRFQGRAYFSEAGKLSRFAGIAQEVTQPQPIADHRQQRIYEAITASTPDLVYAFDLSYRFTYANQALLAMWGSTWEKAIGKRLLENGYEPWHAQMHEREIDQVVATKQPIRGEVAFPHATLGKRIYDYVFAPIFNEKGKVEAIAGTTRDITDRKRAEAALKVSEERFRSFVMASSDVVYSMSADWQQMNQLEGKTFLADTQQPSRDWLLKYIPATDQALVESTVEAAIAGKRVFELEHQVIQADGQIGWTFSRAVPILDEQGQILEWLGAASDVTEQVQALQQKEQSQRQLLALFEQSPVGLATLSADDELVFQWANTFYGELVARPNQALVGKPLLEALPEIKGQGFDGILKEVIATGTPYTALEVAVNILRDGRLTTIYVDLAYQPRKGTQGEVEGILVVATDVTQQVRSRKEIEASQQLLRDLVLSAPIGISILNAADLVIETVNDVFIEVAGKTYEQLIGQHYWVPFAEVAPYYADALSRVAQEGEAFSINEVEMMLIRHGQEELIYVTFVYMPIKDTAGRVQKVAVWVLENTHQVSQRRKIEEQVQQRTEELAAANEELAATNEELTATNEELAGSNEEYAAINEELEEANFLLNRSNDNLQQFAYVASHDLQEPLRKVQSFGDLLTQQYSDQLGEGVTYLERMQAAASRMSGLIKDLLAYSRIATQRDSSGPVSLASIVQTVLTDLDLVIEETGAQVAVSPLPTIDGDRSQLEQLFQNLLANALKFRQPDVTPRIQVKAGWLAADHLPMGIKPARKSIAYHRIEVIDNGVGFDEKYLDRIFQVFQRLHGKSQFAGSGIGLAICEKVVTNHGGAITASSQPGQGATFSVYLPV